MPFGNIEYVYVVGIDTIKVKVRQCNLDGGVVLLKVCV